MFKMDNVICAILLSLLLISGELHASAGSIIYSHGDNYALNKDGQKRKLSKSAEIFAGDTLVTGSNGRMHLRFSDGGMVSVYPRSEYKIETYNFVEGDDSRQQGLFSLLKGGARQITGLLGRFKREQFKFRTSVATIGIRGTGFYVQLCQADCYDAAGNLLADGMYVKNDTGIISMSNDAGEIILAQGQSAHSSDNNHAPEQIYEPPAPYNLASNDIETFDFDTGDVVEKSITQVVVGPAEPLITAAYMNAIYIDLCDGHCVNIRTANTANTGETITQDANTFKAYEGTDGFLTPAGFDSTGGQLAETGSNQEYNVIWSRWTGAYAVSNDGAVVASVVGDIHLIGAAALTLESALPKSGGISYRSIDGTAPTFLGPGGAISGTQDLTFNIDYTSRTIDSLTLNATFTGETITAQLSATSGEIFAGVSHTASIFGNCPVALCSSAFMSGQMTFNLVGSAAQGAIGVYGLGGADVSVTGSYLATDVATQPTRVP